MADSNAARAAVPHLSTVRNATLVGDPRIQVPLAIGPCITILTEPIDSVVVLTIPAIRSLSPYFHASPRDRPWHALMPAIWLQLIQSTSIICTCVPTLKRVLADLQTGMMGGAVSDFFEMSVSGARSNPDGSGSKPDSAASASAPRTRSRSAGVWSGFHRSHSVVERVESQERLRDDVIVQSLEYEVRYGARGSSTSHDVDYGETHSSRGA